MNIIFIFGLVILILIVYLFNIIIHIKTQKIPNTNIIFIDKKSRNLAQFILQQNKKIRKSPFLIFLIFTFIVVGIWMIFGLHYYSLEDDNPAPNNIGDAYGAVNTLFSGLAFVGVIIAILLQSKELKSQREELKLTKNELAGQKHELEIQNQTAQRVRFENIFFNMLSSHREILENVSYKKQKGMAAINNIWYEVSQSIKLKKYTNQNLFLHNTYKELENIKNEDDILNWLKKDSHLYDMLFQI